jgi:hypothetical protein
MKTSTAIHQQELITLKAILGNNFQRFCATVTKKELNLFCSSKILLDS